MTNLHIPTAVECEPMQGERAFSILRVSTKKQLKGESIEVQRTDNKEYCCRQGYKYHEEMVIAETASKTEQRYTFMDCIDYVVEHSKEIDVVVIWKVDRFSRGGEFEYHQLKAALAKFGVRLESATENIDDTPSGEAMVGFLAVVARLENRIRSDRLHGAEKKLTAEGWWCRNAPTGFRNEKVAVGVGEDGKLIKRPSLKPVSEKQWKLLCDAFQEQLRGEHPTVVARKYAERGLLTCHGNPMSPQTWSKMIINPVYGGMNKEKWTDYKLIAAKWDGALTSDEWHKLQKKLPTYKKRTDTQAKRRHKYNPEFPLRNFLRCPHCTEPLRGGASTGKGGRYAYYDCKNKECKLRLYPEEVHEQFLSFMDTVKPTKELLKLFRAIIVDSWEKQFAELNSDNAERGEEIVLLRKERQSILNLMKTSQDDVALLEGLKEDYKRVDDSIKDLDSKQNEGIIEEYNVDAIVSYCTYFMEHLSELWQKADVEAKYKLQHLVFPTGLSHDCLEGKRTPELSLVYQALRDIDVSKEGMVARRGIEPLFPG